MLVNFNVPSQFIQFFALLRTSRSRAVLFLAFFLILLLCASRTLLLFELVHASDPLHDLRVFVLLSTTHTFSFQLCFAINDVFFQLFQLAPLCGADASTLLFFWFPLLFVLHLCLNRWRCSFLLFWFGRHFCLLSSQNEEAAFWFKSLHHFACINVLFSHFKIRRFLTLCSSLFLVLFARQGSDLPVKGSYLSIDIRLVLFCCCFVNLQWTVFRFEELHSLSSHLLHDTSARHLGSRRKLRQGN